MQRISGPGDALEAFRAMLEKYEIQTVRDDLRRTGEALEAVDDQRSELDTERGAIQTTLEGLASEADSSRLRLERHRLSEELQGHALDWAVRTVADSLIRQAQSKFEQERQPDVIRQADVSSSTSPMVPIRPCFPRWVVPGSRSGTPLASTKRRTS